MTLEKIKGSGASEFEVIAHGEGFKMGVRFWREPATKGIVIGFRLRFIKDVEGQWVTPSDLASAFPLIPKWDGSSQKHASLSGGIQLPVSTFRPDKAHEIMVQQKIPADLYKSFKEKLPTLNFLLDEEGFNAFVMERVAFLDVKPAIEEVPIEAVVISIHGFKKGSHEVESQGGKSSGDSDVDAENHGDDAGDDSGSDAAEVGAVSESPSKKLAKAPKKKKAP